MHDERVVHFATLSDFLKSLEDKSSKEFWPDILVYAAKPHMTSRILPDYKNICTSQTTFLTVAAGKGLSHYQELLGEGPALVRAMPNTPSAIGKGVSLLISSVTSPLAQEKKKQVTSLMDSVGSSYWCASEDEFDRATTLSGCGPAYVFAIVEALEEAARSLGLSQEMAQNLTYETFQGALSYLASNNRTAADLREEVTSPGGVTQAALSILQGTEGLNSLFCNALQKAYQRALDFREPSS